MRYDQLSEAARRQVDAQVGRQVRKRDQRQATEPGLPLRCARCDEVFTSPTKAEAHANEVHGGARLVAVLPSG